jgi:hypothetical protein
LVFITPLILLANAGFSLDKLSHKVFKNFSSLLLSLCYKPLISEISLFLFSFPIANEKFTYEEKLFAKAPSEKTPNGALSMFSILGCLCGM